MIDGNSLKRWRKAAGLTQKQAARMALVSLTRLITAEIGESPLTQDELNALKTIYKIEIRESACAALAEMQRVEIKAELTSAVVAEQGMRR